jgi:Asp-tRNA(Asn)/Glu-tRNA(Gln) amidotransferase B subunit
MSHRLFVIVNGNCVKKDLDFEDVVLNKFNEGVYIGELIDLVRDKKVSILNAKEIAFKIIDGLKSSPSQLML